MTTKKSKNIDKLLTTITGISRQEAETQQICTWCKLPLTQFRDTLSQKVWSISGMCQSCQDESFKEVDIDKGSL